MVTGVGCPRETRRWLRPPCFENDQVAQSVHVRYLPKIHQALSLRLGQQTTLKHLRVLDIDAMTIEFIDLVNIVLTTGIVGAIVVAPILKKETAVLRARNERRRLRWAKVCAARGYPPA